MSTAVVVLYLEAREFASLFRGRTTGMAMSCGRSCLPRRRRVHAPAPGIEADLLPQGALAGLASLGSESALSMVCAVEGVMLPSPSEHG